MEHLCSGEDKRRRGGGGEERGGEGRRGEGSGVGEGRRGEGKGGGDERGGTQGRGGREIVDEVNYVVSCTSDYTGNSTHNPAVLVPCSTY